MGCKSMAPVMEQLAAEYAGKVKVVGMDIGTYQDMSGKLGIVGIPLTIFFKQGKEVARVPGGSKALLKDAFDKLSTN